MRIKKWKIILVVLIISVAGGFYFIKIKQKKSGAEAVKEVTPFIGSIRIIISSTGTVLPKNRLEVKPPVNGRVEQILVQEGDKVKSGQILAWMSSTERAALLDAARGRGEKELKYWEDAYKAIPLLSPINGEVIVAKTQPGQAVITSDAVLVLSDMLIVRAQVDETDIGKIAADMKAMISLDAYPDAKIKSLVQHIYYESKTVNNVTIYEVDLLPEETPAFFRSGMNTNVDFIFKSKKDILLIPAEAEIKEKDGSFVLLKQDGVGEPVKTKVELGISDDKNIEVLSGVSLTDRLVVKSKKYSLPKNDTGSNPFMPGRRR